MFIGVNVLINLAIGFAVSTLINLFTPKPDTGKVNDLNIPRSEWGSPIAEIFGSYKVTGNLIWGQDKIERKSGGKGGGGGTYSYVGNFAVLLAQGTEDMKISRMWLNKKIVYDRSADPASIPATRNDPPTTRNDGDRYTVGTAPTGAWVGQEAQIAQWNARLDDWDFYPAASTTKEVSDRSSQYFRFYSGSAGQNPDPLIEAVKGVGNTSAYRYRSYIVFEGLPLTDSQGGTFDFGANFPQVEVELVSNGAVDANGFVTRPKILISDIITRICAKSGIPATDIDVSQITEQINGFAILAQETGAESLSKLANIFQFDFTEGEKITFRPVSRSLAMSIPFTDIAAHEFGQTRPDNYSEEITETLQLPREIKFNYRDFQLDHRNNIVYARRQTASQTQNSESFQADIVLDRNQAQTSVDRTLHLAWVRRSLLKFVTTLAYSELEAGDRISVDNGNDIEDFVISKLETTANHLINFESYPYSEFSNNYKSAIANSTVPPSTIISQGNTRLYLLDIPLIANEDADNTLYVAANGTVTGWRGCGVFVSRDAGSNYELAKTISGAATIANASNILGNFTGTGTDNTNTLTVVLESGNSLESTTAINLPFTNQALIGSEIIRFTTATLTATKTYQLSGLIRGDRGTEWAIATHTVNEKFYLLSTVSKIQGSLSDIGVARLFKAPTSDQTLGTVPAINFTTTGKCLEPLAPLPVSAYKPSTNIIINFARRDRHDYGATGTVKLSEFDERYEIDILNGATVVRTIAVTSPTATYTQAQQIADFGLAQTAIVIDVYQLSKDVGRGFARRYSSGTLGLTDPVTYPTVASTTSSVANTANTTANTAQTTANTANTTAIAAQTEANKKLTVQSAGVTIGTAETIKTVNFVSGATVTAVGLDKVDVAIANTGADIAWSQLTSDRIGTSNNFYVNQKPVSQLQLTLPTTSAINDEFGCASATQYGFALVQQANQYIQNENNLTSEGNGIQSTAIGTAVKLVCIEANKGWLVTNKLGIVNNYGISYDFDTAAIINAIQATGITLSPAQKNIISTRIVNAKSDGVWDKWYAYYGFVGGTAASHAINWKFPSTGLYNITWNGSLIHSNLGVKGSGGYGNTGFRSSTVSGLTTVGLSIYLTEPQSTATNTIESSCSLSGVTFGLFLFLTYYAGELGTAASNFTDTSNSIWGKSLYSANFIPNLYTFNINGASILNSTVAATTTTLPNANLFIFDENRDNTGTIGRFSDARMGSYCINKGYTSSQESANYISELAFQTALGRN